VTTSRASDAEVAVHVARLTGERLVRVRDALQSAGASPRDVRDEGDDAAQVAIADLLRELRPTDAVLSEEALDDPARLGAARVWIVDPLDGTQEYSEHGRTDWAVHVALWERSAAPDGAVTAAAVALPAEGRVLATHPAPPAPPAREGVPRVLVSRSRAPREALVVARALGAEVRALGSAGAKTMAVVRGDAELYVHAGGQHQWDSAAPVAVALAAGLHASCLDGSPLVYNRADTWLPDLIVCRPELAESALAALRRG
jgi:3'(2'), 5'-bisphosphate nucleotidase